MDSRALPLSVARPRVVERLSTLAAPVRVLLAPHGSGKTTALREYAARTPGVAYVALPSGAGKAQAMRLLRAVSGAEEIALDDAERISPPALAWLNGRLQGLSADDPRYLVAVASRSALQVQQLVAAGIAELVDARTLAFDDAEIASLCATLAVAAERSDVDQLLFDTEGWAVAVSWIVREAAREARSLRGAFDAWAERRQHLLFEFITESVADERTSRLFRAVLGGKYAGDVEEALHDLEAAGYPIARTRDALRPYRVLRRPAAPPAAANVGTELLKLTLFGRFACSIDGRDVTFPRRREQSVLAYVALAPDASVPRAELMQAFWPGAPRAVASQGLRTTLSRLRRGIGAVSGCDAGRYLVVGTRVALDLQHVTVDARRFADHVAQGRADDAAGNVQGVRDHYRFARRLYADALLASEAVDRPLAPRVAEYAAMFDAVLARLSELDGSARGWGRHLAAVAATR